MVMQSVISRIIVLAIVALPLAGCSAVAISALGGGTAAGVSYTMSGTVSRTFTAPLPNVRAAALAALQNMQIDVSSIGKAGDGKEISAKSVSRSIDIELEEISPNVTRMSVSAKSGFFHSDSATGAEILQQTGRKIGEL